MCHPVPVCINLAASEQRGWHENAGEEDKRGRLSAQKGFTLWEGRKGHIILDGGVGGREAVVGGQNCAEGLKGAQEVGKAE